LNQQENLYVWRSSTETYNPITNNTKALGTREDGIYYELSKVGSTYSSHTYWISVDDTFTDGYASWGIANSSGDLYLGVNQDDGLDVSSVYFNPRNKRTNLKYKFD
jgi:hypothetical protein